MSAPPASECVDAGDTTWVLLSTILVLGMMPALAFFEAGLLRRKNTLSIITEVFVGLALMQLMWYMVGFSLVYDDDNWGVIGGFDYIFLNGLGNVCVPNAPTIPGLAFASFQSMFAAVTPLLMTGAVAERMKFRSFLLFIILWELLVYYPLAHWIWGQGFLKQWGVFDFAGGIVIHTSSGTSSLVLAMFLGHRQDFDKYHGEFPPHNIPLAALGTALLWMGWYGFNAGSALSAGTVAAYAISATTVASSVGVIVWSCLSLFRHRHVHTVAVLNGAIAGMAGITPVSGYIESSWAAFVAVIIAVSAYLGIILFKDKLRIDDALDVSSVHGVTGALGSIAVGFFASQSVNPDGPNGWIYGNFSQVYIQICAVLLTMAYSAFWTVILLFTFRLSKFFKLNVEEDIERVGLDYYYHGDVAYHHLETLDTDELDKLTSATIEAVRHESHTEGDQTGNEEFVIYDSDTGSAYARSFLSVQEDRGRQRVSSFEVGEESHLLSVDEANARQATASATRSRPMVFVRQDSVLSVPEDVRRGLDARKAGGIRL
mmetsp:Transcript_2779/g.9805  ORF Transcript_2779/g.9805 Transcript_2779/m.9805 type:complete len:543 (+) Transcript_2779:250-1878(+)|eukprot:CAMPEP_0114624494 /NCGR_PEP_ID=MMETSP0168-20121206/10794_1 /TAXON_ID=95228 ORGANISM="Vannella sp., Strain DIVA3 517/6/12" /NCGR_SAMPLE_ID=MMETSP0168 /ASSEMBLY_ACC=CAM_ASM_000044 /LENGTH=542 /DNA_ID=CAMNT_0001835767 /DNA_START=157 /DNA_END=1785 /DNA_ORIENTATION=+